MEGDRIHNRAPLKYWRDPDSVWKTVQQHCTSNSYSQGGTFFNPNIWAETEGSYFLVPEHVTPEAVWELCDRVLRDSGVCSYCGLIYSEGCPLLDDVAQQVNWDRVLIKCPQCIQLAWTRAQRSPFLREFAINFFVKKGYVNAPLWVQKMMARCDKIRCWGDLCRPDIYCAACRRPTDYDNLRVPTRELQQGEKAPTKKVAKKPTQTLIKIKIGVGAKKTQGSG